MCVCVTVEDFVTYPQYTCAFIVRKWVVCTKGSIYHFSGCTEERRKKSLPAPDMETSVLDYLLLVIIGCAAAAGRSNMNRTLRSHFMQHI